MNNSDQTRKTQVLDYLQERFNTWVDGSELATEEVGGSEGLRRIRDLRSDGWLIVQRHHPDTNRDIWQYKLTNDQNVEEVLPFPTPTVPNYVVRKVIIHTSVGPAERKYADPPKHINFGETMLCPRCQGRKNEPGAGRSVPCKRCGGIGLVPTLGANR